MTDEYPFQVCALGIGEAERGGVVGHHVLDGFSIGVDQTLPLEEAGEEIGVGNGTRNLVDVVTLEEVEKDWDNE